MDVVEKGSEEVNKELRKKDNELEKGRKHAILQACCAGIKASNDKDQIIDFLTKLNELGPKFGIAEADIMELINLADLTISKMQSPDNLEEKEELSKTVAEEAVQHDLKKEDQELKALGRPEEEHKASVKRTEVDTASDDGWTVVQPRRVRQQDQENAARARASGPLTKPSAQSSRQKSRPSHRKKGG